jgi:maleylpyruvate isomerase
VAIPNAASLHGDVPSIADICLAGQVINNGRFEVDTSRYPSIERINNNCMALEAFTSAHPSVQADAE